MKARSQSRAFKIRSQWTCMNISDEIRGFILEKQYNRRENNEIRV